MRYFLPVFLFSGVVSAQFNLQQPAVSVDAARLSLISHTFTDIRTYNSYAHNGSPLGILESERRQRALNVGYRRVSLRNTEENDSLLRIDAFRLPSLLIGAPDRIYGMLNYSLSAVGRHQGDATPALSLPLSRFGLLFCAQSASRAFRMGFAFDGFYGEVDGDGTSDSRLRTGVDKIALSFGSELDRFVRVGLTAGAKGCFDTLYAFNEDRFAEMSVPLVGLDLDIGKDDSPYLSNFSIGYGRNHFVYTINARHRDAITADSVAFDWKNSLTLSTRGALLVRPALSLGFFTARHRQWLARGDNYPIVDYGDERSGMDWTTTLFRFGFGTAVAYADHGRAWIEYGRAATALGLGERREELHGNDTERKGFNRFGLGCRANTHTLARSRFPASTELFLSVGYLFAQENGLFADYREQDFTHVNHLEAGSQSTRYEPEQRIAERTALSNIGFGLGGTFLEKKFAADAHLGFVTRRFRSDSVAPSRGIELGVDLSYNVMSSSPGEDVTTE